MVEKYQKLYLPFDKLLCFVKNESTSPKYSKLQYEITRQEFTFMFSKTGKTKTTNIFLKVKTDSSQKPHLKADTINDVKTDLRTFLERANKTG